MTIPLPAGIDGVGKCATSGEQLRENGLQLA
jgi:hypothetical protein